MQLKASYTILFTLLGFASVCAGGPPCGGTRSQVICARNIRPYSDNAYTWKNVCGFTADPSALIAQDVEKWDPDPGCTGPYIATCCARTAGCATYVDCDGPETALPDPIPVENILPTGWQVAVPCAVDVPERVLANVVVTYADSTTPRTCALQCQSMGYRYAGVEYGDECYCGTGFAPTGVVPTSADPSECNVRCAGIYQYTCGGPWRMQIFHLP